MLLFAASGCSALIYEVVWFHLVGLVIGASALSLAILLASFMGGMCLGSLAFPRLVSARRHPLRVYAILELGIGLLGIALLMFLPAASRLYTALAGYGYAGIALRGTVCIVALLPPTILMGATLPAISRWVRTTPKGISRLGFFYGANIFGAVIGSLLAGFYLLRLYDVVTATLFAAALNTAVALVALLLAGKSSFKPPKFAETPSAAPRSPSAVHVAIALSGMTALGAEVVWTRLLSLLFGATVYTFSIILAVFLTGLGIGSAAGSILARRTRRPKLAFGCCQLLAAIFVPFAAYVIIEKMPYWRADPNFLSWATDSVMRLYVFDMARCAAAILPATIAWGASFPLALAAAGSRGQDPGRLVGGIYAANTIGAIGGSLIFGLVMIPSVGTQRAQQCLAVLAACAALLMLGSVVFSSRSADRPAKAPRRKFFQRSPAAAVLALVLILALTALSSRWVPPVPKGLIAYGRTIDDWDYVIAYPYVAEGVSASVAVSDTFEGDRNFHVSGKVVASTIAIDMRLQRMLGHLPALVHPGPRSVLVVGCGAGVTAGSFVVHPGIESIVICEIEPRVVDAAREYFARENHGVLDDPRTEVILDDARHYLATTRRKFDIITADPIHPWVRGAAALYSTEFYELCKERLNPGGIVTQWLPLYETSEEAVKSELATFVQAFPHATVWETDVWYREGYDMVMLGQEGATRIDVDAVEARIARAEDLRESLAEVDLASAVQLMGTYAGQGPELEPWLRDGEINRDRSLRL